ncbi:MAG: hypothetical protein ACRCX2_19795 [Paraclostridium sp.]
MFTLSSEELILGYKNSEFNTDYIDKDTIDGVTLIDITYKNGVYKLFKNAVFVSEIDDIDQLSIISFKVSELIKDTNSVIYSLKIYSDELTLKEIEKNNNFEIGVSRIK